MKIDVRHLQLLADVMTFKGKVLGINRHGIHKMKSSSLMLASFEKTTDHLYDAAVQCKKDDISGVSECIITGNLVKLGTGAFDVVMDKDMLPPGKAVKAAYKVDTGPQRSAYLFDAIN